MAERDQPVKRAATRPPAPPGDADADWRSDDRLVWMRHALLHAERKPSKRCLLNHCLWQ
jgi:hypothetical protein